VRILIDTHTFLWWSLSPERLPTRVTRLLKDPDNSILFSVVSSWEAAIKQGLGKLTLSKPLRNLIEDEVSRNRWQILPVLLPHTFRLEELPPLHRDPFDRLLLAQAMVEDLAIATRDPLIASYGLTEIVWE
jgi:PIN domain nuclease of toxin-antitoxin system